MFPRRAARAGFQPCAGNTTPRIVDWRHSPIRATRCRINGKSSWTTLTLNARAEYWRDDNNFFVASFLSNSAPVLAEQGFAPFVHSAPGGSTSYGALTFGVTWKPKVPAPITGLLLRPEVRWDHAFTSNHPFNAQRDTNGESRSAWTQS